MRPESPRKPPVRGQPSSAPGSYPPPARVLVLAWFLLLGLSLHPPARAQNSAAGVEPAVAGGPARVAQSGSSNKSNSSNKRNSSNKGNSSNNRSRGQKATGSSSPSTPARGNQGAGPRKNVPPPPEPPPPAPPALEAARVSMDSNPAAALVLLLELSRRAELHRVHQQETRALSAQALERLELPILALLLHLEQLELGGEATLQEAAWQAAAWQAAVPLARRVNLEPLLIAPSAGVDVKRLSEPLRSQTLYYQGLERGLANARRESAVALSQVAGEQPDFVRARLELANVFVGLRRPALALATLEDLASTHAIQVALRPELAAVVHLNLARAYYGMGRVEEAIARYEQVPRSSPAWLQVQQELAWSWYRMFADGEDLPALNRALGMLHTLNAPYFDGFYLPEAALLEAQLLYQLCRFVEGSQRLKAFNARQIPQRDRLKRALEGELSSPAAVLEVGLELHMKQRAQQSSAAQSPALRSGIAALSVRPGSTANLPRLSPAAQALPAAWHLQLTSSPELHRLEALLQGVEAERRRLQVVGVGWPTGEVQALSARLGTLEARARERTGLSLRSRLEDVLAELNVYLGDSQLFDLNMITAEKELYEAAAAGRMPEQVPERLRPRPAAWPPAARIWPFEGEYWVDELGYYRARAEPLCPD